MARKAKKHEHVNHERWLVSYADFVTLLFAFFTSLYAMSTIDAKKAGQMIISTRNAFSLDLFPSDKQTHGEENPADKQVEANIKMIKQELMGKVAKSKKPPPINPEKGMQLREFRALFADLSKTIGLKKLPGMTVTNNKYGVVVSLKDVLFFDPAKAELRQSALRDLDAIAERILQGHFDIRVEGHTDGSMVKASHYKSNWELSTARAASVVSYFIEQFGYPPDQLSVAGYASTKPLTTNDTAAGRAANRRVDIVVLMPTHDWLPSPSEVNNPQPEQFEDSERGGRPAGTEDRGAAPHDTGMVNPRIK